MLQRFKSVPAGRSSWSEQNLRSDGDACRDVRITDRLVNARTPATERYAGFLQAARSLVTVFQLRAVVGAPTARSMAFGVSFDRPIPST